MLKQYVSATINGDLLCLPWETNPTFLHFNRDIFTKANVAPPPETGGKLPLAADAGIGRSRGGGSIEKRRPGPLRSTLRATPPSAIK